MPLCSAVEGLESRTVGAEDTVPIPRVHAAIPSLIPRTEWLLLCGTLHVLQKCALLLSLIPIHLVHS